jgi:hypothetical protein
MVAYFTDLKRKTAINNIDAKTKLGKTLLQDKMPYRGEPRPPISDTQKARSLRCAIPLPAWACSYMGHEGRMYAHGPAGEGQTGAPLHTPLHLQCGLTYPDRILQNGKSTEGILVEYIDDNGDITTLPFTRDQGMLSRKDEMIAELVKAGVRITPAGIDALCNGIISAGPRAKGAVVFDFPGWRGDKFFVTPGGGVIGETEYPIRLASPLPGIKKIGTLEGWVDAAASAFCEEIILKAPHIPMAILWGFVSPLVDRGCEEMSLILNFGWRTTQLKSFALQAMGSVWGDIRPTEGIITTFSATSNMTEQYAIQRSGCGLGVDESQLADDPAEIGRLAYRLATGVEKGRMTAKASRYWRLACALTSEVPLMQLIRAGGREPPPGLMSRVVEAPGPTERVSDPPIEALRVIADPKHIAHHGHAGPAFVRAMLAEGFTREKIATVIKERVDKILGGRGDNEQARRAVRAIAFICLAAEIAKRAKLIPETFDIEAFCVALWDGAKGAADTSRGVVTRVVGYLAKAFYANSVQIYDDKRRVALGDGRTGAFCFLSFGPDRVPAFVLPATSFKAYIGKGETESDAAKILDSEGVLYREQDDRLHWRKGRAGVGEVISYAVYASAVLGDDAADIIRQHLEARRGEDAA